MAFKNHKQNLAVKVKRKNNKAERPNNKVVIIS